MAKKPQSARDLFWNILFNREWQHTVEEGMLVDAIRIVLHSIFNTFLDQPLKAVRVMLQIAEVIDYDASKAVVAKTWNQDNCPTFKVLKALSDELNQPIRVIMETPNGKVRLESPHQAMKRLTESLDDSPALGGKDAVWKWFFHLKNPQKPTVDTLSTDSDSGKKAKKPKKRRRGGPKPTFVGTGMSALELLRDSMPEAKKPSNGIHVIEGIVVMPDNTDDGNSPVAN